MFNCTRIVLALAILLGGVTSVHAQPGFGDHSVIWDYEQNQDTLAPGDTLSVDGTATIYSGQLPWTREVLVRWTDILAPIEDDFWVDPNGASVILPEANTSIDIVFQSEITVSNDPKVCPCSVEARAIVWRFLNHQIEDAQSKYFMRANPANGSGSVGGDE